MNKLEIKGIVYRYGEASVVVSTDAGKSTIALPPADLSKFRMQLPKHVVLTLEYPDKDEAADEEEEAAAAASGEGEGEDDDAASESEVADELTGKGDDAGESEVADADKIVDDALAGDAGDDEVADADKIVDDALAGDAGDDEDTNPVIDADKGVLG